tara:strand:- start:4963 stop:5124 length:162 start_codon:yes stop_codon:yes gene_type:complete
MTACVAGLLWGKTRPPGIAIQAMLAGVILPFAIPLPGMPGKPDDEEDSPLHRL